MPMKAAAMFLLPLGVVMFFAANGLWRLIAFNQHVAVAWLFVSLILCALGLYSLKNWSRITYGVLEVAVGALITLAAINAYGVAQDREIIPIVGGRIFHERPEGVFQLSGPEIALFGMLAAIYILVRGFENIGEGLRTRSRTTEEKVSSSSDNLESLHEHEEQLRRKSLEEIKASSDLTDHWNLVGEAMNVIYAFTHDHPHGSDNELTLQYLGIRLFNACGASIKLAISGYYQKAFDQLRDIIETYFLVDYLTTNPTQITVWKVADKKTRIAKFGPGVIRNALDKRDGHTSGARKQIYDLISEFASHASYPGITLTTTGPAKMAQIGPFYDQQKLAMWLYEMAMRVSHAAVVLVSDAEGDDRPLLVTRAHYLTVVNAWWQKHRQMSPQAKP